MVRYLADKGADVNRAANDGATPAYIAAFYGHLDVVRYLARFGCSFSRRTNDGGTALSAARQNNHHDTARLLSDIDSAGGWRPYAAACRMAYVRIRHEVSKTYAVLDEGHEDRELLHLVFGRNRAAVDAAADEAVDSAAWTGLNDGGSDKPKAMQELPDVVFRLVCRFLE